MSGSEPTQPLFYKRTATSPPNFREAADRIDEIQDYFRPALNMRSNGLERRIHWVIAVRPIFNSLAPYCEAHADLKSLASLAML